MTKDASYAEAGPEEVPSDELKGGKKRPPGKESRDAD